MSLNGYSWVEGNTPNRVDPSGLCSNTQPRFLRPQCRELARSLSSRYNIPLENLIHENFEDLLAFEAVARLNDAAIIPNLIREYGFERPLEAFPELWQEGLENDKGYTASGNLETLWEGRELWFAIVYEPTDWAATAQAWLCGDFHWIDAIALAPLIPNRRIILDIFGGEYSQTRNVLRYGDAINVDIIASQGVRASALTLPFKSGSVDEIIINNPYIQGNVDSFRVTIYEEASRVLKENSTVIVNASTANPYRVAPTQITNCRLVSQLPLDARFSNITFRRTNGSVISQSEMETLIYIKVGSS